MVSQAFSVGNDFVDFSALEAQSKPSDQRFIQRVFEVQEQKCIQSARDPIRVLWAIWAAKEAAYKACQKQCGSLIFSHRQFVVAETSLLQLQGLDRFNHPCEGLLNVAKHPVAIQWTWHQEGVHCVAAKLDAKPSQPPWHTLQTYLIKIDPQPEPWQTQWMEHHFTVTERSSIFSTQSLQTRFYAKQFLHQQGLSGHLQIIRPLIITKGYAHKRYGPPQLWLDYQPCAHEISLSHDGHWGAFVVSGV